MHIIYHVEPLCLPSPPQTLGTDQDTIRVDLPLLIDCTFCAATGMIAYGAVIGKATPTQLMWIMVALGAYLQMDRGSSTALAQVQPSPPLSLLVQTCGCAISLVGCMVPVQGLLDLLLPFRNDSQLIRNQYAISPQDDPYGRDGWWWAPCACVSASHMQIALHTQYDTDDPCGRDGGGPGSRRPQHPGHA
ncbi:hypothetical protein DUNSADRAFT_6068 [Dunaliella salina]|uniref:Uncharacterized protein n=1 Tax=Dunaliella salina TaxID=3046 RepID=A0ABQ7FTZ1_DUNSA|nr:hypothetical protein DUNSADRAFT_6068 [Dunaliella salina]|eukprot:KAF5825901.1 hypothetical protein DUNSADRAFT_6068 [Dunaliella salina]